MESLERSASGISIIPNNNGLLPSKGTGDSRSDAPKIGSQRSLQSTPMASTTRNDAKRKRPSPFRIKEGCIVAMRHKRDGNHIGLVQSGEVVREIDLNEHFIQVWTDPVFGRDDGLALVGKRIRCFFPKSENIRRSVLEGEIVCVHNYEVSQKLGKPFKVELLIDVAQLQYFPFLKRTDEIMDVSQLTNDTAIRNFRREEALKGKDKATVILKLCAPSDLEAIKCLRWVVLRRVPSKWLQKVARRDSTAVTTNPTEEATFPSNTSAYSDASATSNKRMASDQGVASGKRRKMAERPAVRHMGDGNDSSDQQINNWRWVCSRYQKAYFNECVESSFDSFSAEYLSFGFVGQTVKIEVSKSSDTLAWVTVKRLFLPEHTISGRTPHHKPLELFDDFDNKERNSSQLLLRIPVEELVIVVPSNSVAGVLRADNDLCLIRSYSCENDSYFPRDDKNDVNYANGYTVCHSCRRALGEEEGSTCQALPCTVRLGTSTSWCNECLKTDNFLDGKDSLPCCRKICQCEKCLSADAPDSDKFLLSQLEQSLPRNRNGRSQGLSLSNVAKCLESVAASGFALSLTNVELSALPTPALKPVLKIRPKAMLKPKRPTSTRKEKTNVRKTSGEAHHTAPQNDQQSSELSNDDNVFKPTSAKLEVYDPFRKWKVYPVSELQSTTDQRRNLRLVVSKQGPDEPEKDDKVTTSRAARANQRRFMKDVVALGALSLNLDSLAAREPQLRFDRSGIHAWGVFADEDIAAGEMIIEYRGEIIGNAMAEKREREYEAAKVGSDYMFRIDSLTVCDATKQGNVARFINASCDPNCYTKIISIDGNKRIVIYAKKDIKVGEELCYDYKFPHELDESKWIPCYCGARECRKFMNVDVRKVSLKQLGQAQGAATGEPKKALSVSSGTLGANP